MNVLAVRLLCVVGLGLSACHRANKPIEPRPVASNAAPPVAGLGSAKPQDSMSTVCGDIRREEPKQFVLRLHSALEADDLTTWNGLQSSRFQQSIRADPGLARMRFDVWKKAFRDRVPELVGMMCLMEGRDSAISCDTQKPMKFRVAREGCELKLDD